MKEETMLKDRKKILALVMLATMGVVSGAGLSDLAWAQHAANVKELSNPDRQEIYWQRILVGVPMGLSIGTSTAPPVPAGKRWIIEHVSTVFELETNKLMMLSVSVNPSFDRPVLVPAVLQSSYNGRDHFVASQPMRLRLGPGEILTCTVERNGTTPTENVLFFILGYLIDYP
jgi:hypothetical protein